MVEGSLQKATNAIRPLENSSLLNQKGKRMKTNKQKCLTRKSRVSREAPARFCERLGVKLPLSTRLVPAEKGN